ncbi:hypothetical protein SAMN04488113_12723 [Alkalibacterium gilvum]|uniref:Uncharacterized protein n=1 Tax=Alkalibacterium gilvum TaxID=1130080 RepID=A0A1H6U3Y3_9LACT|nr:hypothetical protein [Alkalibacterium gilvum]SEI87023.1 hypothetical protein SAMN04488113_12723 [Alkalibacterium gilvum]
MIIPCQLQHIDQGFTTLYDYKNKKTHIIKLTEQDHDYYTTLLEETADDDLPEYLESDNRLDPFVFYDTASKQLVSVPDDDRLSLFY